MPKVGVIYNDVKPVACQVAHELQDKLLALGYNVSMVTGVGGILGYSNPNRPICHTPIESLAPEDFDEDG